MRLPTFSFESLLETIPDAAFIVDQRGKIALANVQAQTLFGYQSGELDDQSIDVLVPRPSRKGHARQVSEFFVHPKPRRLNTRHNLSGQRKDGTVFPADIWLAPIQITNAWITLCILHDISPRKQIEAELRESEARYRGLVENMVEGFAYCQMVFENDRPVDWIYWIVNDAFERLTGLVDIEGRKVSDAIPGILQSDPELFEVYGRVASTGEPERFETYVNALKMWFDISVYCPQPGYFVAMFDVITERKETAEALTLFRRLIEQSNDAIEVIDPTSGRLLDANQKACQGLGYSREDYLALTVFDINPDLDLEQFNASNGILRQSGTIYVEGKRRRKDGSAYPVEMNLSYVHLERDYVVSVARDITDRLRRERELESIAEVGAALRVAHGLGEMRPIILRELLSILQADGALLATVDDATGQLAFDLGAGDWAELTGRHLPAGATVVGQVIRTGEMFVSNPTADGPLDSESGSMFHFHALGVVPLTDRHGTLGAIAVGRPDGFASDDIRLLTSIADMVANAVRRVTLREQTERDALELTRAYDSTIAGWSNALDLRDHETEGHTLRVTDLTLKLALEAGFTQDELAHVRRGGLLHDIGKMAVPDAILLKQGPLTDDEWEVMRRHPGTAFELLSPIDYLRPALDIPYCHHERWDGGGYPRGLKGVDIPKAARLFAVVDVWDALISNRPYRAAWSEDKAIAHLREQSGKHFDPEAVELFFKVLNI